MGCDGPDGLWDQHSLRREPSKADSGLPSPLLSRVLSSPCVMDRPPCTGVVITIAQDSEQPWGHMPSLQLQIPGVPRSDAIS